ncbi:neural proliferation differentiation and control protein 1a [Alosa alosa]|uniref:neural proliferation differentiation and control protein 1a n=1 Tax=Alosa alosa TaxID=278164 RepID=UPI0020150E9D|nr:neural proliferation differentiation and control protein 1a [Alosa alosa]XP_048115522.1 neural proliferation differentiation and control protein 1a [Alosa alosa]
MLLRRRIDRPPRARLCPGLLLCIVFATVAASVPEKRCPHHIDCAREKREFCQPGSSRCGPCHTPFEEDEEGKCVIRRHHRPETFYSDLDEEIDFLSSVIAKQQLSKDKQSVSPSRVTDGSRTDGDAQQRAVLQPSTTPGPSTPTHQTPKPPLPLTQVGRSGPGARTNLSRDTLLVIVISICIIVGTISMIFATVFWVKLQRESRLAQKVDYPAFGTAGPVKMPSANGTKRSGDKDLAQSAQMYHYQHQKQQMLSLEKHKDNPRVSESGATSDEENEEGDFTVYECPGLAPTGELEVKNPLFDDSTLNQQRNHK